MKLTPLLLAIFLFSACGNATSNATTADTPSVTTADTSFSSPVTLVPIASSHPLAQILLKSADDWNKGDLKGFMDYYDDSATMMTKHGLINKDTMTVHYRQTYFKDGAPKQQLSFDQFQIIDLGH